MSNAPRTATAAFLPPETQKVVNAIEALSTDETLALLYFVYEKMGDTITPAAPSAAEPELTPRLLGDVFSMSEDEQLAVMRAIANGDDTDLSRAYGALTENNQLMLWYAWAQGMGDTVVDLPKGYEATNAVTKALQQIEPLEFQEQISLLRTVAGGMGCQQAHPIPSQAETGKTPSL